MKRFYFSKLVLLAAILLGWNPGVYAQTTYSVNNATGNASAAYTYTVTAGTSLLAIDMAGGNGGTSNCSGVGGMGGRVQCQLVVTSGEVLYIYVAGAGKNYACCTTVAGGYNGGGNGFEYGGSGAGESDISLTSGTITARNRIIVAGGGGGAGYNWCSEIGGQGGGLTGGGAVAYGGAPSSYGGSGGTQASGGTGASYCCGGSQNGSLGVGGNAPSNFGGGGGAGGYYGGGSGDEYCGGGGGSSYPAANGGNISALTHTQGYWAGGDGYVTITPLVPLVTAAPATLDFGSQITGTLSIPQYISLTGVRLTGFPGNLTATAPSGFLIATDASMALYSGGPLAWSTTQTIPYTAAIFGPVNLYVQFDPAFPISYCGGSINISGGGQPANCMIPVCGTGVSACSALPTAGTASVTPNSGGTTSTFTLSLAGTSIGGGILYQWQSSTDSATWTNINGAVLATSIFTGISANTWFRCLVTCPSNGTSTSSVTSATFVSGGMAASSCTTPMSLNPPGGLVVNYGFYVASTPYPFTVTGDVGGSSIDDNNNPYTSGSAIYYYDYTGSQSVNMTAGNNYTCTHNFICNNASSFQVWIDFNNNGVFDAGESVGGENIPGSTLMAPFSISIPATVVGGTYRMRVVMDFNGGGVCNSNYPCYPNVVPCFTTTVDYAEARDYTAIIGPPKCSGTPEPGISFVPVTTGCGAYNSNLYSIGAANTLTGLTSNWQTSPDNHTWTNIAGAINPDYTETVTGTIYVRNSITCAYGSTAYTASAELQYNTAPAAITGSTLTFCSATPSALSDATPGGSWSSSNLAVASVGSAGLVTGLSGGTATISYTMPGGCSAMQTVTVYLSPAAITGTPSVCTGLTTALTDATPGGVWSSGFPGFASVSGTGLVTGISSGVDVITYKIPTGGCYVTQSVPVNTQPGPITGTASACVGASTTLYTTSTGGTWASSNSFQASVNSTGLVSGLLSGNPTISYTLPGGCSATVTTTINPLPSAITGTADVCVGLITALSDGSPSGAWSSVSPSIATVDGSGNVTGLTSGTSNIKYTYTATGCAVAYAVNVHSNPAIYSVTGGGGYCTGTSGVDVGLSNSAYGIEYYLFNTASGLTPIDSLPGSSSGLNFGPMVSDPSYTVSARDATYGCVSNMSGSVSAVENSLPAVYSMSEIPALGFYCAGGAGVDLQLSGSDAGVQYQAIIGGSVFSKPAVNGTGVLGNFDLGDYTDSGNYTITATNTATGCSSSMSGSEMIYIKAAPSIDTIGGGGSYCFNDTGVHITLNTSTAAGVDYRLYNGLSGRDTVSGTGGPLDFGLYTDSGNYTITAYDFTSGCQSEMYGTAKVRVSPLPVAQSVTGGGAYCAGTTGVHVGLHYSVSGTSYQLYANSVVAGAPLPGSNSGIDFGLDTTIGTYTVIGTNGFGCTSLMTGSVTVTENALPSVYAISASGGYCAGTSGYDVYVNPSDIGTHYQLYNGLSIVGSAKNGVVGKLDFGNMPAGNYTITATNTAGCSDKMSGTAVIVANPLPASYVVSGGGAYCAGPTGKDVYVNMSDTGVTYNLYVTGVGSSVYSLTGTGSSLDFVSETLPGTYTVVASNNTTGCPRNMAGSATIIVNPAPNIDTVTVTNGGNYCSGGVGQHIGLNTSTSGVNYTLTDGVVSNTLSGSGTTLDFGIYSDNGTYNVQANNTITGCSSYMYGNPVITMLVPPVAYTVGETGTGAYCAGGAGVELTLDGSQNTVKYYMYNTTTHTPAGNVTGSGAGGAFSLGMQTAGGKYTVTGTDTTTGCSNNMNSSANVTVNPLPAAYLVTGGGHTCSFGVGDTIGLAGSNLSTNYQVYTGGVADGSVWAGTGLPIYLGLHSNSGYYTVVATNPTTTCTNTMTDSVQVIVDPTVVPGVTISTASDTVCSGVSTNFTAVTGGGGGLTPVYSWKVNGVHAGSGATLAYYPANGDVVTATLTSSAACAMPSSASNSVTMTVAPSALPAVAITADHSDVICPGTNVTFNAAPSYGGSSPSYTWVKNSLNVGTGSSYSYTFTGSEVVFCEMVSNYQCRTTSFVLSNNIAENVDSPILPNFIISANPGASINMGQSLTLQAVVANIGGVYTYQWYINDVLQYGQTSPTFTFGNYSDMDVVKCIVTSVGVCGGLPASQSIVITVKNTTGVAQMSGNDDVRIIPNPNKGMFIVKGTIGNTTDQEVTLQVTDMLGQVVYNNKVMATGGNINEQIQLSHSLANGMYLLNVRSGSDTKVFHFVLEQ